MAAKQTKPRAEPRGEVTRYRLLTKQDYIAIDGQLKHGLSGDVVRDLPPESIQEFIRERLIQPA